MKTLFILFLFLFSPIFSENKILFYKLLDGTRYNGTYDISREITDLLARKLTETGKYAVFPQSFTALKTQRARRSDLNDIELLTQLGRRHNANIVITGVITKFNITSSSLYGEDVAGYKVSVGVVQLEYQILNVQTEKQYFYEAIGRKADHDLGLSFFGGPGGAEDQESITPIERVEKLKFNSPLFNATVLGKALHKSIDQVINKVIEQFPGMKRTLIGKVIDIDGYDIYINLGTKQNILEGQKFIIYESGKPIVDPDTEETLGFREINKASIQVDRVLAAKLSKARVIGQAEKKIEIGDKIKVYTSPAIKKRLD